MRLEPHKIIQWAKHGCGGVYGGYLRGIMIENEQYITTGKLPWNVIIAIHMWRKIRKQMKNE